MNVQGFDAGQLLDFYETMVRIRRFEEQVFEFYKKGMMAGLAHLYLGQEAIATGVIAALEPEDYIGSHHRGHGHLVARGSDMGRMMAEILGKETGYCRGKGGSMHIMDLERGILGANGIVGAGIPIATGAAYKTLYRGGREITVCFMGDAATNEGSFHEALNMAAAWHLPILYVIENNLYGISVDIRDVTNTPDLADRAAGYGMPGFVVDGMDVAAVHTASRDAVDKVRAGGGPMLMECKTYRWQGHHVGDPALYRKRRSESEKEDWMARCPIAGLKNALLEAGMAKPGQLEEREAIVEREIEAAIQFAEGSAYPPAEDAYTDVFV